MGFSTTFLTCATIALAYAVVLSKAQPNAPTSVNITYNDWTSAILSWDTPTTTTVDYYVYRLKSSADCVNWPSDWTSVKPTWDTQVVVPATQGGCIVAKVRARDPSRQWSPWTRSRSYKQDYTRPDAPKNLELSAIDGQLVATWDTSFDSHSFIESYSVVLIVQNCSDIASRQKTVYETTSSSFVFPIEVDVEKCYRVKVLARTAARSGPFAVARYDPGSSYPTQSYPANVCEFTRGGFVGKKGGIEIQASSVTLDSFTLIRNYHTFLEVTVFVETFDGEVLFSQIVPIGSTPFVINSNGLELNGYYRIYGEASPGYGTWGAYRYQDFPVTLYREVSSFGTVADVVATRGYTGPNSEYGSDGIFYSFCAFNFGILNSTSPTS